MNFLYKFHSPKIIIYFGLITFGGGGGGFIGVKPSSVAKDCLDIASCSLSQDTLRKPDNSIAVRKIIFFMRKYFNFVQRLPQQDGSRYRLPLWGSDPLVGSECGA